MLTHSANLAPKQSRGLDQTLAKARRRLTELQARLARGRTRRDRATVEAEIAAICKPRWVADIITVTLTGEAPAELRLTWRSDTCARARLSRGGSLRLSAPLWSVPNRAGCTSPGSGCRFACAPSAARSR